MAQGQRQPRPERQVASTDIVGGREGARWVNRRPDGEEFAEWMLENVPLDEGMQAKDYVGGMTLIPATERVKYVKGMDAQGVAVIGEREQLVYVPYPKVEARLAYWWKLLELRKDDWHGLIKPIIKPRIEDDSAIGRINKTLPPGFWILAVPVGETYTYFICYSVAVRIYEKPIEYTVFNDERIIASEPIREGEATKQVPLLRRGYNNSVYADDTALMRAETGAKGRALGMAGILIVPGSSIATAEDMLEGFGVVIPTTQEAQAEGGGAKLPEIKPGAATTGAEKAEQTKDDLIAEARAILQALSESFPDAYAQFLEWSRAKNPPIRNIGDLDGPALRGCVKKLQNFLKEAQAAATAAAEQDANAEAPDESADDSGEPSLPSETAEVTEQE